MVSFTGSSKISTGFGFSKGANKHKDYDVKFSLQFWRKNENKGNKKKRNEKWER